MTMLLKNIKSTLMLVIPHETNILVQRVLNAVSTIDTLKIIRLTKYGVYLKGSSLKILFC